MGLWSNVTSIASDVKDKVSSAVSNATSSIWNWLNSTYNNTNTASIISSQGTSTNTSSSSTTSNATGSSSIYDNTNKTTTKTPTQYSSTKAYETDKTKNTTVENIQKSLSTLGYTYGDEGELKIDGDFGTKTQSNWDNFISDLGVDNYLSGIGNTSKSTSDYLIDNKFFNNYSNTNESTISAPTGNEYIFYGDPITEFKKNVLGLDENIQNSSNTGSSFTDVMSGIFAFGDTLKDAQIYNNSQLLGNDELLQSASTVGKKISQIGKIVDYGTFGKNILNGDVDEAAIKLAGIAGGTAGGILGGAAGATMGGIPGIATGTMGAVAGSELLENIVREILENT